MANNMNLEFEVYTVTLRDILAARKNEISWAVSFLQSVTDIESNYATHYDVQDIHSSVVHQLQKVKELEQYLVVDIIRHITTQHGRTPFYFENISDLLKRSRSLLQNAKGAKAESYSRQLDHLSAEFQAVFGEYGFYKIFDVIYEPDEAFQKLKLLDGALDKAIRGSTPDQIIEGLYEANATLHGTIQVLSYGSFTKVAGNFQHLSTKLHNALQRYITDNFHSKSVLMLEYLAHQNLLRKPFMKSIRSIDDRSAVEEHIIVPGTRVWLLERIQKWMNDREKRLYYVGGKHGSGKTALASAVCKLFVPNLSGSYFFSNGRAGMRNNMCEMIQSIADGLCHSVPEYANWMDDRYSGNTAGLEKLQSAAWQENYNSLIKEPLQAIFGQGRNTITTGKRRLIVIDGCDEMDEDEWASFKQFQATFFKDISPVFCLLITIRFKYFNHLIHVDQDKVEGVKFEDKSWYNRHIKDIEMYLTSSMGAILSGEDERDLPQHVKADDTTLQNSVDELLKMSGGRFSSAIALMENFAQEFGGSGQFLGSLKKCVQPVRDSTGSQSFDARVNDFASPYRAYRDKEGRSVVVRVMRQSQYPMDKTRVALIRGRHKIK